MSWSPAWMSTNSKSTSTPPDPADLSKFQKNIRCHQQPRHSTATCPSLIYKSYTSYRSHMSYSPQQSGAVVPIQIVKNMKIIYLRSRNIMQS